tara:strand:- start:529 stop:1257 length:729 start_codon:yes stop_codon:yes gene_type:complete
MNRKLRLGVNIDHVATIRNARGGIHPDPIQAAKIAQTAGADSIVCHLREDRRHISDEDLLRLIEQIKLPLNLEMATTEEMLEIALRHQPPGVCLVPEKRQEITTEGGLNIISQFDHITKFVKVLAEANCFVSLFIDPDRNQIDASIATGAPSVEFHTGAYCDAKDVSERKTELARITDAVKYANSFGIEVRAGHGLSYDTVGPIAAIEGIVELNIGHFIIGEAIFCGLEKAIHNMRELMDKV